LNTLRQGSEPLTVPSLLIPRKTTTYSGVKATTCSMA
jgi:hypothetical protein